MYSLAYIFNAEQFSRIMSAILEIKMHESCFQYDYFKHEGAV